MTFEEFCKSNWQVQGELREAKRLRERGDEEAALNIEYSDEQYWDDDD